MKNPSKYAGRSLRYLVRMIILLTLVFLIMYYAGLLDESAGTVGQVLFSTWKGWGLMAALLLLAAGYPSYSFTTVTVTGVDSTNNEMVRKCFEAYGYEPERNADGQTVYRAASSSRRILMQFDDGVTVTRKENGIEIEGLKKIVNRVAMRIDAAANPDQ